jgi:hypothetical protein
MKILDILDEYREQNKSYAGLDVFRQFNRGPDHITPDEFSNDNIKVPNVSQSSGRDSRRSTSANIPSLVWIKTKSAKQPDTLKQQQHIEKVNSIYSQIKNAAEQKNRQPFFSYYKDNTFGCGIVSRNGVKIGIGPQRGPFTELGYSMDNVPQDDGKETIRNVMNDAGYSSVKTAVTKLRFKPKSQNMSNIIADFWNVIDLVESLGPDFKRSNRFGTGAGSLITGKQAPWQYYLWLANNIYESVRKNTEWGFSRGGGDIGDGAYDRNDDLLIIGITKGGIKQIKSGRNAYREHVVPSDYINRMGIEICRKYPKTANYKNQVIKEVALMIWRNLAIVLCSSPPKDNSGKILKDPRNPTEQEIVDSEFQITMPPGWKDGDSILARFSYYNIPVYKNKKNDASNNGKRMAE